MNHNFMMRRGVIACAGMLVALAATAETGKIAANSTAVMAGAGSFFPKKGELKGGAEVEILGTQGPWTKVKTAAVEGYIPSSSLVAKKGGGLGLGKAIGSSEASVSSETAGVKGFNEDIEKAHAKEHGVDWSAIEKLDGQSISTELMLAFLRERGLLEKTK